MRISPAVFGALAVTLASSIFGTVGIAVQAAVAAGFALPLLLAMRYLATAGAVHSIALARKEHRVRRFGRPHLAAFGLGLAALGQTGCYFAAMTRIDVALVLALHFTFPGIVLIAEALHARRWPGRRQLASCALALVGVALVVLAGGTRGVDPIGLVLALGSGISYAAIILGWTRVLRRLPSAAATAFQTTGLGVAWLIACIVLGVNFDLPGISALQWLVILIVFCSVVPMLLLASGTARVGSVASSTLSTAEPVVGAVVAAVMLNQLPTPLAVLGCGMIVCASLIVVAPTPHQSLRYVRTGAHHASRTLVRVGNTPHHGLAPVGLVRARPEGVGRPGGRTRGQRPRSNRPGATRQPLAAGSVH